MGKLRIGTTDYTLTSKKASSPALKLVKGGVTSYGFLSTVKPSTKTLKVGDKYLNQPKVPFTITLPISIHAATNANAYSAYLSQANVYGATWSFSGRARQNESKWRESSGNHGGIYAGDYKIYDIGHSHQENTGWRTVSGNGTLKTDSTTLGDVSKRMRIHGVGTSRYDIIVGHGDDREHETIIVRPVSYLEGTLTITGYKLP